MTTLTITAEGELTLGKQLLDHLGLSPGDKVVAEPLADGRIEVRPARGTGKISEVFGSLDDFKGPALTVEEINQAAAEGWAGIR